MVRDLPFLIILQTLPFTPIFSEEKPSDSYPGRVNLLPLCLASTPHMNEQMTAGSHL